VDQRVGAFILQIQLPKLTGRHIRRVTYSNVPFSWVAQKQCVIGSLDTGMTQAKLTRQGYDSVVIKGFRTGVEFVVYDSNQVELLTVRKSDGGPEYDVSSMAERSLCLRYEGAMLSAQIFFKAASSLASDVDKGIVDAGRIIKDSSRAHGPDFSRHTHHLMGDLVVGVGDGAHVLHDSIMKHGPDVVRDGSIFGRDVLIGLSDGASALRETSSEHYGDILDSGRDLGSSLSAGFEEATASVRHGFGAHGSDVLHSGRDILRDVVGGVVDASTVLSASRLELMKMGLDSLSVIRDEILRILRARTRDVNAHSDALVANGLIMLHDVARSLARAASIIANVSQTEGHAFVQDGVRVIVDFGRGLTQAACILANAAMHHGPIFARQSVHFFRDVAHGIAGAARTVAIAASRHGPDALMEGLLLVRDLNVGIARGLCIVGQSFHRHGPTTLVTGMHFAHAIGINLASAARAVARHFMSAVEGMAEFMERVRDLFD